MKLTLNISDNDYKNYKRFLESLGTYEKVTKEIIIHELQAELDASVFQSINN